MSESAPVESAPSSAPESSESSPNEGSQSSAPSRYKLGDKEYSQEELSYRLKLSEVATKERASAQSLAKEKAALEKALAGDAESRKLLKERLGPNYRAFLEEAAREILEEDALSPEEKAFRKRERELAEKEAKYKKEQEAIEAENLSKLERQHLERLDKEITEAIMGHGLPKSPYAVSRMAALMEQNLEMGLELTASEVATLVKEEMGGNVSSSISGLDGDSLLSFLGEETVEKVRKALLGKVGQPVGGGLQKRGSAPVQPKESNEKKPMDRKEWERLAEERRKALKD